MSLKICYIKYNVLLDLNCIATITTTIIVNSTTAPLGTVIFLHPYTMLSPGDKGLVQQQNTHFSYPRDVIRTIQRYYIQITDSVFPKSFASSEWNVSQVGRLQNQMF